MENERYFYTQIVHRSFARCVFTMGRYVPFPVNLATPGSTRVTVMIPGLAWLPDQWSNDPYLKHESLPQTLHNSIPPGIAWLREHATLLSVQDKHSKSSRRTETVFSRRHSIVIHLPVFSRYESHTCEIPPLSNEGTVFKYGIWKFSTSKTSAINWRAIRTFSYHIHGLLFNLAANDQTATVADVNTRTHPTNSRCPFHRRNRTGLPNTDNSAVYNRSARRTDPPDRSVCLPATYRR